MNGFGRFGLHLLNYYLESEEESAFELKYINDDMLDINKALDIINNDPYVKIYNRFHVRIEGNLLIFNDIYKIEYSNKKSEEVSWLGSPDIFLECTGQYTDANLARKFKIKNTKKVLISATSMNADQMLVYGFNHNEYKSESDVISYGSCTINAFVPLTNFLDEKFKVISSDVNVIHNVPAYQLKNGYIATPGLKETPIKRKKCTLSQISPKLLSCTTIDNFNVNYTLIPYTGVSMIDYRYSFKNKLNEHFWRILENECLNGKLKGLIAIQDNDTGPEDHQNTKYSAVIVKENSYIKGCDVYLHAYFDNENSVNRYFDLINYISSNIELEYS